MKAKEIKNGYLCLYKKILEITENPEAKIPPEYKERVLKELGKLEKRNNRHLKVICMRYGIGEREGGRPMTQREIGDKIGVSKVRAGQIEASAIREMRRTHRADMWKEEQWKQEEIKEKNTNPEIVNIEAMGLSVRAENCLYRAGKRTLQDIAELEKKDILRIRNAGEKTADEIIKKRDALMSMLETKKEQEDTK